MQGQAASDALDRGMEAVRLLHHDYASDVTRLRRNASKHAEREGIAFPIGTCFVHRVRGFRAVVHGWDRKCERSAAWAASNQANPQQPFYYCLPDEDDCQRVFGGRRMLQYVAQDDMDAAPGTRIMHRAIRNLFSSYSTQDGGRYVPNSKLAFEYPDEYPEPELSIADDANILARAEQEEQVAPLPTFSPQERFEQD
ncbi:hypothetical protein WJX81_002951 [Elliptochloris bilobata]|uniref:Hemimethylated DNA-binding domain-containing protein n=1 Tax=Elliptochloris bilobata TaxID=381761 RepID=A0AAW1S7D2_9CHLO